VSSIRSVPDSFNVGGARVGDVPVPAAAGTVDGFDAERLVQFLGADGESALPCRLCFRWSLRKKTCVRSLFICLLVAAVNNLYEEEKAVVPAVDFPVVDSGDEIEIEWLAPPG